MTDETIAAAGDARSEGKIHGFSAVAASTDTVTMEPK